MRWARRPRHIHASAAGSTVAQKPLPPAPTKESLLHPSAPVQRLPAALLVAGLVLSAFGAPVALATERGDEIPHTVQPGDTLEGLAQSYLAAPQLWPRLQARNKVKDPKHLQPGSVVWIPVSLQPAESASVEFVHGNVKALPPHAPRKGRQRSASQRAPGRRHQAGSRHRWLCRRATGRRLHRAGERPV